MITVKKVVIFKLQIHQEIQFIITMVMVTMQICTSSTRKKNNPK